MKIVYPKNSSGESVSFATNEKDVYDNNGTSLSDKLNLINTQLNESESIQNTNKMYDDVKATSDLCNTINSKVNKLSGDIDSLKKSVSDGKQKVAVAITSMGVQTAIDESFSSMKNKISSITTNNIKVDGAKPSKDLRVYLNAHNYGLADLPRTKVELPSYKPYCFENGAAIIYKNKLWLIGASASKSSQGIEHAARSQCLTLNTDNNRWDTMASLPNPGTSPNTGIGMLIGATIANNKLYVVQGYSNFYVYNDSASSWSTIKSIPVSSYDVNVNLITFNNKPMIIKSVVKKSSSVTTVSFDYYFYDEDSNTWSSVGSTVSVQLPSSVNTVSDDSRISSIVIGNNIHVFMKFYHFIINSNLTNVSVELSFNVPMDDDERINPFVVNNEIYAVSAFKGWYSNTLSYIFKYDTDKHVFISGCCLEIYHTFGSIVVDETNKKLYILGGSYVGDNVYNARVYDIDFSKILYALESTEPIN